MPNISTSLTEVKSVVIGITTRGASNTGKNLKRENQLSYSPNHARHTAHTFYQSRYVLLQEYL